MTFFMLGQCFLILFIVETAICSNNYMEARVGKENKLALFVSQAVRMIAWFIKRFTGVLKRLQKFQSTIIVYCRVSMVQKYSTLSF